MIRLLTAALLVASFGALAQTQVPNVFEDGTPATAAEVNANFDAHWKQPSTMYQPVQMAEPF